MEKQSWRGIAAKSVGIALCFLCVWEMGVEAAPKYNMFTRRYIQIFPGFNKDEQLQEGIAILQRASKAGYNGMRADNGYFGRVHKVNSRVLDRIKKFRAAADDLNLVFIPSSFGQTEPSREDIKNAEAFPVQTLFKVSGTTGAPVGDGTIRPNNGDFETWASANKPASWSLQGLVPGSDLFADLSEKPSATTGKASLRIQMHKQKPVKLKQTISLKKGRAYRVTLWAKVARGVNTRDMGVEAFGLDGKRWLFHVRDHKGMTADDRWRKYVWDFNSLNCSQAGFNVILASKTLTTGNVWIDDLSIEEIGLLGTQTRTSTPVSVKFADGRKINLAAGKDYTVGKGVLTIPAGSAIKGGDQLVVNWYQIAAVETMMPPSSFCHEEPWTFYRKNVQGMVDAVGPVQGWFLKPSEWRVAFWDPECIKQYKNSGEFMGSVAKKCVALLKGFNANMETYIWNDDYDPYHNARPDYPYMVNGPFMGSWNYMDTASVIINWVPATRRAQSFAFFAGTDPKYPTFRHRQLLSIVDGNVGNWFSILNSFEAKHGAKSKDACVGFLYNTWSNYYEQLEPLRRACESAGRWASGGPGIPAPGIVKNNPVVKHVSRLKMISTTDGRFAVRYEIKATGNVQVMVRDLQGRLVKTLFRGVQSGGTHQIAWDHSGLGAGVYFVMLKTGEGVERRRVIVF